jgi:hypothetical protein
MLLRGKGMELVFDGSDTQRIDTPYRPFVFDGGCKTCCRLIDGPVKDMNLIVDSERAKGVMAILPVDATESLEIAFHWIVLYCLDGAVSISASGYDYRLDRGDSLRIDDAVGSSVVFRARELGTSLAFIGIQSEPVGVSRR